MLPTGECVASQDVCCTSLYDVANHILAGVYESLLECFQPSFCNGNGLLAYVTMGNGDDLVLDGLSVAVNDVRPSDGSIRYSQTSPMVTYMATFNVRLLESGWPMAYEDNGEIFVPDPVDQNALARHAYGHGERMYRKLAYMASHGDLAPAGTPCSKAILMPLTPLNPSGGSIGWTTSVLMQLTLAG